MTRFKRSFGKDARDTKMQSRTCFNVAYCFRIVLVLCDVSFKAHQQPPEARAGQPRRAQKTPAAPPQRKSAPSCPPYRFRDPL